MNPFIQGFFAPLAWLRERAEWLYTVAAYRLGFVVAVVLVLVAVSIPFRIAAALRRRRKARTIGR